MFFIPSISFNPLVSVSRKQIIGHSLVIANRMQVNHRKRTQGVGDRFGGWDQESDHPLSTRLRSSKPRWGRMKNQKEKEESFDAGAPGERCGQDPKKGLGRKRKGREHHETPLRDLSTQSRKLLCQRSSNKVANINVSILCMKPGQKQWIHRRLGQIQTSVTGRQEREREGLQISPCVPQWHCLSKEKEAQCLGI